MNWLAHVLLSEPDPEFQLGNLFADSVKGRELLDMSPAFRRGTECHRAIDIFTDRHPITLVSRSRTNAGRYSGILVDLFYDHFLARNWDVYASAPLQSFTASFYRTTAPYETALPAHARFAYKVMTSEDLLASYAHVEGIAQALRRISARLSSRTGQPIALDSAVSELTDNYDALAQDFSAFFPLLQRYVRER